MTNSNLLDDETLLLDLNDPYVVMHLVGDVNDHLLEQGLDDDAADWILQVKGLKASYPQWTVDDLVDLANQYCRVEIVSDLDDRVDARPIIEDDEEDEVSDDFSVVNAALASDAGLHAPIATPVDLSMPEFPQVGIYWDFEEDLLFNMKNALRAIASMDDDRAVRSFIQDWNALKHHTFTYKAMFQLVWSYITVMPIEEQYGSEDW